MSTKLTVGAICLATLALTTLKTGFGRVVTPTDGAIAAQTQQEAIQASLPQLPPNIEAKVVALGQCESHGDPAAVNPIDRDGTPSNGKYQFKRGTWRAYVLKYKLWGSDQWEPADFENTLFSGYHQDYVVRLMFTDPQVNLQWEFPACSKKLGLPKNYAAVQQAFGGSC